MSAALGRAPLSGPLRPAPPLPVPTSLLSGDSPAQEDWARLDVCPTCKVPAGERCIVLNDCYKPKGSPASRRHAARRIAPDRLRLTYRNGKHWRDEMRDEQAADPTIRSRRKPASQHRKSGRKRVVWVLRPAGWAATGLGREGYEVRLPLRLAREPGRELYVQLSPAEALALAAGLTRQAEIANRLTVATQAAFAEKTVEPTTKTAVQPF